MSIVKPAWIAEKIPIAQTVGVLLLLWALLPINPYIYYFFLRAALMGILIYLAFKANEAKSFAWVAALLAIAILYNPVIPLHLS